MPRRADAFKFLCLRDAVRWSASRSCRALPWKVPAPIHFPGTPAPTRHTRYSRDTKKKSTAQRGKVSHESITCSSRIAWFRALSR